MWSTCPKQKAIRAFDGRSSEGLMAFQWNLLEDILDSVLHIATSFKIVGTETKLRVSKCNTNSVNTENTGLWSAYLHLITDSIR